MSAITSRPRSQIMPPSPGRSGAIQGDQRIVIRGVGWHVYGGVSPRTGGVSARSVITPVPPQPAERATLQ